MGDGGKQPQPRLVATNGKLAPEAPFRVAGQGEITHLVLERDATADLAMEFEPPGRSALGGHAQAMHDVCTVRMHDFRCWPVEMCRAFGSSRN